MAAHTTVMAHLAKRGERHKRTNEDDGQRQKTRRGDDVETVTVHETAQPGDGGSSHRQDQPGGVQTEIGDRGTAGGGARANRALLSAAGYFLKKDDRLFSFPLQRKSMHIRAVQRIFTEVCATAI